MKSNISIPGFLVFILIGISGGIYSQEFSLVGGQASGSQVAWANDYCAGIPGFGCVPINQSIFVTQSCALPDWMTGVFGSDLATYCGSDVKEVGDQICAPNLDFAASNALSYAFVKNNLTDLNLEWWNSGRNYVTVDGDYANYAEAVMNFNLSIDIVNLPVGTNVEIWYKYNIFGSGNTAHETAMDEDSIFVNHSFFFNGTDVTGTTYNFTSPGSLPGWNQSAMTGSFTMAVGTPLQILVSSYVAMYLNPLAMPGGFGCPVDEQDAVFRGSVQLSLTPFYDISEAAASFPDKKLLFSLDLGSDSEYSEPQQDGNENFDPGDVYARSTSPLPTPSLFDDLTIFGHDPVPAMSGPSLPYHSGVPITIASSSYFDLDGTDNIDFSLSGSGAIYPMPYTPSECVHQGSEFLISFEDDDSVNWSSPMPALPTEGLSPSGNMYGSFSDNNEVYSLHTNYIYPGSAYFIPVLDEQEVHGALAPAAAGAASDDDVDALDMIPFYNSGTETPCDIRYFSADHEARYNWPGLVPPSLNPGSIYEVVPGSGLVEVVTTAMLGLPDSTDIDDFEFGVYLSHMNIGDVEMLAVFFSVDDNDPDTPGDESGGLSPNMIYFSLMNGANAPYLTTPLQDDIDAIALWDQFLTPDLACSQVYAPDADGDSYGNVLYVINTCSPPPGYVTNILDCDDMDATKYPGAPGTGQGIDNNCNGVIDAAEQLCLMTLSPDQDGDGFGDNVWVTFTGCTPPPGFVFNSGDCDDSDPSVYPGAPGVHQCKDNNCDGIIDSSESALCLGDFTADYTRNVSDLLLFMSSMGCVSGCGCYDLNGDGVVNTTDLLLFLPLFGSFCP